MIDAVLDMASIYTPQRSILEEQQPSSIITLDNGMILHLKSINSQLALVSLIRSEHFSKQGEEDTLIFKGLVEYNFDIVSKAILEVF
jgi:hypothetical protein